MDKIMFEFQMNMTDMNEKYLIEKLKEREKEFDKLQSKTIEFFIVSSYNDLRKSLQKSVDN